MKGALIVWTAALLIAITGCGAEVRHSGEATVNHVVSVDIEGLTSFFTDFCAIDDGLDEAGVRECALTHVGRFIEFVEGAAQ